MSFRRLPAAGLVAGLLGCPTAARRATILYTNVVAAMSPKDAIIDIKRSFLERHKDRITIDAHFTVDNAMESPNANLLDGDLHIGGRAPEIGLRLVAEIKNADSAARAREVVQRAESTHVALALTGVWRLWPEHALLPESQGQNVQPLATPNPDHLFELHPVIRVGGIDLLHTFHPVPGYRPGNAERTFGIYQKADCKMELYDSTVRLTISNWLYNDVHFVMELSGDPQVVVEDGRFVTAAALALDGTRLVEGLRMALVKNSGPEQAVRRLRRGGRLHVWGLPRVSFAELSRRMAGASRGAVLEGSLPYEIIVLGVYADSL